MSFYAQEQMSFNDALTSDEGNKNSDVWSLSGSRYSARSSSMKAPSNEPWLNPWRDSNVQEANLEHLHKSSENCSYVKTAVQPTHNFTTSAEEYAPPGTLLSSTSLSTAQSRNYPYLLPSVNNDVWKIFSSNFRDWVGVSVTPTTAEEAPSTSSTYSLQETINMNASAPNSLNREITNLSMNDSLLDCSQSGFCKTTGHHRNHHQKENAEFKQELCMELKREQDNFKQHLATKDSLISSYEILRQKMAQVDELKCEITQLNGKIQTADNSAKRWKAFSEEMAKRSTDLQASSPAQISELNKQRESEKIKSLITEDSSSSVSRADSDNALLMKGIYVYSNNGIYALHNNGSHPYSNNEAYALSNNGTDTFSNNGINAACINGTHAHYNNETYAAYFNETYAFTNKGTQSQCCSEQHIEQHTDIPRPWSRVVSSEITNKQQF